MKLGYKFALLLLLTLYSFEAKADDSFCMQFYKPPEINLYTNKGKVNYNHNLNSQQIAQLSKKTGADAYQKHPTTGLTFANFYTMIEIGTNAITVGDKMCLVVEKVNYTMGYKNIDIYVDKKYEKGSCEYDVVLEHENTHKKIFQASVDYYAPYFAKEVKKSLSNMKAVRINSIDDVHIIRKQIQEKLDKDLAYLSKFYETARDKENQKLDTPENYIATSALCKNW
jgi:hypothetical protein